jgi:hypothetical protein
MKFLLWKPLFSDVYESKKGEEIVLPTCVLCHLAKSSLFLQAPQMVQERLRSFIGWDDHGDRHDVCASFRVRTRAPVLGQRQTLQISASSLQRGLRVELMGLEPGVGHPGRPLDHATALPHLRQGACEDAPVMLKGPK